MLFISSIIKNRTKDQPAKGALRRFFWPVLLVIITVMSLSFIAPATTQAHPPLGFTPTPTPTPTNTPILPPTATPTSPPDTPPEDEIEVTLGCDLTCSPEDAAITVSFPVQLVHLGSGWIVETTLSNGGSTQLPIPYPGEWEVIMTGPPSFSQGTSVEYANTYPVSLGTVQANSGLQVVDCPIECPEIPDFLPATGADDFPLLIIIIFFSVVILVSGVLKGTLSARTKNNSSADG